MRWELRRSRFPRPRLKGAEVVAVGHPRQTGVEILQIGHRVLAGALARDNQGVEDGGAWTGVGMTDGAPDFLAEVIAPLRLHGGTLGRAGRRMIGRASSAWGDPGRPLTRGEVNGEFDWSGEGGSLSGWLVTNNWRSCGSSATCA